MLRTLLILTFLFCIRNSANAQTDSLFNSKGVYLGDRAELVGECIKGLKEDRSLAIFDANMACSCLITVVLSQPEIDNADAEVDLDEVDFDKMMESDPEMMQEFQGCMMESMAGDVPIRSMGKDAMKEMTESCIVEMNKNPEMEASGIDAKIVCECMFEQVERRNMTMAQLQDAQDPNSPMFNEVMIPCVTKAMGHAQASPNAGSPDVSGKKMTDRVPVLPLGNLHKVKVTLGGVDQYYIIDSGASDCIISNTFAARLKDAGKLSADTGLGRSVYKLADGREVECDRFLAQGMVIGEFTVNNVVIAVIDEEIQFLLGKSFLDKFFEWTIETRTNNLYLKRQ